MQRQMQLNVTPRAETPELYRHNQLLFVQRKKYWGFRGVGSRGQIKKICIITYF